MSSSLAFSAFLEVAYILKDLLNSNHHYSWTLPLTFICSYSCGNWQMVVIVLELKY